MAQGGNVWEWNETAVDGINNSVSENRVLLGGKWSTGSGTLIAKSPSGYDPLNSYADTGFRVAMVPEPSSILHFIAGGTVLMAVRRFRRA